MSGWWWAALAFDLAALMVARVGHRGFGGVVFLAWLAGALTIIAIWQSWTPAAVG